MQANPGKFQLIISHRTDKRIVQMNVNDIIITSSNTVKLLGITFDSELTFNDHISVTCKKASRQLNVLKRFSAILSRKNKELIFQSFILSHFNYCSVVWNFCRKKKVRQLEKIQERALRFVCNDFNSTYMDLLKICSREPLYVTRTKCLAVQVYKSVNSLSPAYLNSLFVIKECEYNLRNSISLNQPVVNTVTYGLMSLRYHGPKIWNSLSNEIKSAKSLR